MWSCEFIKTQESSLIKINVIENDERVLDILALSKDHGMTL